LKDGGGDRFHAGRRPANRKERTMGKFNEESEIEIRSSIEAEDFESKKS